MSRGFLLNLTFKLNPTISAVQKTMARIPGLPDLSRFVTRTQKVPVHNTVNFLVGVEVFELSGCVLSQKSQVLQDLMGGDREVYLDQFEGEEEGIKDVIELLYGGAVEITEANVKTILKFSVIYEVKDIHMI